MYNKFKNDEIGRLPHLPPTYVALILGTLAILAGLFIYVAENFGIESAMAMYGMPSFAVFCAICFRWFIKYMNENI